MSKLTLWGQPRSINVQKVLWALEELGLPYERIDAGGKFGRNKEPAYLALNPNGLIPTLVDDGEALWESNAILRYLFFTYGKAPLHPATPIARARADAWTEWYGTTLWPELRVLFTQLVRTPEERRDAALIERAQRSVNAALTLLDRELQKHAYVVGEDFTWGDIPIGAALHRWFGLPIARPALPALQTSFQALQKRPAYKKWIDLPIA
jgi:glutathione S-transferase